MENTDRKASASRPVYYDSTVVTKAVFMALIGLLLLGGLRWAMDATNANNRRIAGNLIRMQGRIDDTVAEAEGMTDTKPKKATKDDGPVLEPETPVGKK